MFSPEHCTTAALHQPDCGWFKVEFISGTSLKAPSVAKMRVHPRTGNSDWLEKEAMWKPPQRGAINLLQDSELCSQFGFGFYVISVQICIPLMPKGPIRTRKATKDRHMACYGKHIKNFEEQPAKRAERSCKATVGAAQSLSQREEDATLIRLHPCGANLLSWGRCPF